MAPEHILNSVWLAVGASSRDVCWQHYAAASFLTGRGKGGVGLGVGGEDPLSHRSTEAEVLTVLLVRLKSVWYLNGHIFE